MTERITKYLHDILFAIESIEDFVGSPKIFENYKNDLKTQSAVERQLGIIGEAVNKVLKEDSAIVISNARNIVNLRNRIIHAYDNINDTVIWAIVINHLPRLKNEVTDLIDVSY